MAPNDCYRENMIKIMENFNVRYPRELEPTTRIFQSFVGQTIPNQARIPVPSIGATLPSFSTKISIPMEKSWQELISYNKIVNDLGPIAVVFIFLLLYFIPIQFCSCFFFSMSYYSFINTWNLHSLYSAISAFIIVLHIIMYFESFRPKDKWEILKFHVTPFKHNNITVIELLYFLTYLIFIVLGTSYSNVSAELHIFEICAILFNFICTFEINIFIVSHFKQTE